MTNAPLIETDNLSVRFRASGGVLAGLRSFSAVEGVSLAIPEKESFGLVGESGSGKTTLGRAILRVTPIASGTVAFEGTDLTRLSGGRLRLYRRNMQMIFQNPYGSLNSRLTIEEVVGEGVRTHVSNKRSVIREHVAEALEAVGIEPARMRDYPHQFSGGQRQRIGIARAVALLPRFIVCDEVTSALDMSVRAQIIELLGSLRERFKLTYLIISHDLASLQFLCDRVGVMYLGALVEQGPVRQVLANPRHPYTQSLISAMPVPDPVAERARRRIVLKGDMPDPAKKPTGCTFHTRCWLYEKMGRPAQCTTTAPVLTAKPGGTAAACHFADAAV
jgi:peptide/nickel transport system ATP-binding protein